MMNVEIIPYEKVHKARVKEISYEWLKKYDLLEPLDDEYLDHPEELIFGKGGTIFLAQVDGLIVGTVGIVPCGNDCAEICKLGVTERMKGNKIGPQLVQRCLEWAKEAQIKKIILYSNNKLETALKIYRNIGFREIVDTTNKYEISDVMMELKL